MKKRTILLACLGMATLPLLSASALAEADFNSAGAENISPGSVMRELVRYDPSVISTDWTFREIVSVSGDNREGGSPFKVSFATGTSGSYTTHFGTEITGSYEQDFLVAQVSAGASFPVSDSRSWTTATECGVEQEVAPGKFQVIQAFIPAVLTKGSLVIKAYTEYDLHNYWYEYKTVPSIYLPAEGHIHYKANTITNPYYMDLIETGTPLNQVLEMME